MVRLFGQEYDPTELRKLVGSMDQLAGVRMLEFADGKPRGMRVAEVYTGGGLRFTVLLDRAMDVWAADFAGKSLAWLHPALGGPEFHEPAGYGWGRSWGGGLVTTTGITFFGHPEEDAGEQLGLHGRISHIPAARVKVTQEWRGDDYVLEIEGQTRQTVLGGENLLLTRKISTRLGAASFTLEDTVRNDGFRDTPHMILYHCNFGFPVVSPQSELIANLESVRPRDARAEKGVNRYTRFDDTGEANYDEQVFFHKPWAGGDGYVRVGIANRQLGFGAYIRYRAAELPYLAQWKQMSMGEYVCALEPANQWETPRRKLREEGRLRFLKPGEEVHYQLEFGVLPEAQAVAEFEKQVQG